MGGCVGNRRISCGDACCGG
ncbi:hypothetical protein [Hyphococcus lacteus]